MEIIKKIVIILFLFKINLIQAQLNTDTICKSVKMKVISKKVNKEFVERYNFIVKDEKGEFKRYKDSFGCTLISDYKLEDLSIKVIPKFKLKKGYNMNKNIVNFFDVKQDNHRAFSYIIYHKDALLTTEYSVKNKVSKTAILLNCSLSLLMGNNTAVMMQLRLHEKYFAFKIEDISGVLFIVDNGIVYAITEPKINGDYKKTEINEFFRTHKMKIDNFDSENAENKEIKSKQMFFNKSYFLNIRKK